MASSSVAPAMVRALFRSHLRVRRAFRDAEVPLVGVHGEAWTQGPCVGGCAALAGEFRRPRSPPEAAEATDAAFTALRALKRQLAILKEADEEARVGLKLWRTMLDSSRAEMRSLGQQDSCGHSLLVAGMVERAGFELGALTAPHVFSLDDLLGEGQSPEAMVREARQAIDGIADKVRSSVNMLDAGSQGAASENRAKLIAAMNHVLYSELKYKALPVEWVYDGLSPLLITDVVQKRSGIPLSLGILHQAVAARLGVPCVLHPAKAHEEAAEPGLASLRGATSIGPDPDVWLLSFPAPSSADEPPTVVEPGRKGRILSLDESLQYLHEVADSAETTSAQSRLVRIWAALARAVMVAHMRRGESEAVASWLYQVLALEPEASEWDQILLPSAIAS